MRVHFKVFFAASISPSLPRIFALLAALAIFAASTTSQAEDLREADIAALAKQNNPKAGQLAQTIAVQKTNQKAVALRANPQIAWQREHLTSSSDAEDILSVTLPLNRTRQQRVNQALARTKVAEAKSTALLGGSRAVYRALELFYACLAQEQRIKIEEATWQRLVEAKRVVARRREEGRLSGYELSRVELESEIARSRVEEARTVLASLQSELAPLLGRTVDELNLIGTLVPASTERAENAPASPALLALRSAAGFAGSAKSRAERTWIPTVSATAGMKIANAQDTDYGYVAGLSLNLPIWTGSTAMQKKAHARQEQVVAKADSIIAERSIRAAAAGKTLTGLRTEAERFESATKAQSIALKLAVESGYREGQRTLVELLDASATLSSVRTRTLNLHVAIKLAELELRDSRGEFE